MYIQGTIFVMFCDTVLQWFGAALFGWREGYLACIMYNYNSVLAHGDGIITACCLQVSNAVIVVGGMLP